jgi:hypothetical protein
MQQNFLEGELPEIFPYAQERRLANDSTGPAGV